MKLSLNWIKDYIDIPQNVDLNRLAYDITMSTVEVEGSTNIAKSFENIVVGKVVEVNPHPNADKLRVCRVDTGDGEIHDIVCGGSNLYADELVAVACPGAMVRWHGEGEPVMIKNAKLRGVASYGMICGADEIGLGELLPPSTPAEIVDVTAFNARPGTNLAVALGIDDIILEIDNKSMTNRPDLWGHYGMAREIAALLNLELKPIEPYSIPKDVEPYKVVIEDADKCPRYIAVQINNVCVKDAPFYMRSRLWRVGLRPINALVDITNYVMMSVGQPTHAFDSSMVNDCIVVRRADDGEGIRLLNGKELTLNTQDLVIADSKGALALAGVMGGEKDSILPNTKGILLEIANFEPRGIRKTALRYANRTDASTRYEKGIDPERCDLALSLSMKLLGELYPNLKVTGYSDNYPTKLVAKHIELSYDWLTRRLGKQLTPAEISAKLRLLGVDVSFEGDNMTVDVPSWRSTGDVSIKADIMEEVARMYGYENFEGEKIATTFTGAINQLDKSLVRNIEEYLAYRCGLQEILSYPWMKERFVNAIIGSTEGILTLSTPPSPEERFLRCSTLPNLCQAVVGNERYFNDFAIFEQAQVFADKMIQSTYDNSESLPQQKQFIGAAFAKKTDKIEDITLLFRRVKGILESMPSFVHMQPFSFKKQIQPLWADEVAYLNIFVGEQMVGSMGLLNTKASLLCGIKNLKVVLFEIDTELLIPYKSRTNSFAHLAEYPITEYDLSALLDSKVAWAEVSSTVLSSHNKLIKDVQFVDEYRGKQIPQGMKSLTLRLFIGSNEKTLTGDEIEQCANSVIKTLQKRLNAQIRGK